MSQLVLRFQETSSSAFSNIFASNQATQCSRSFQATSESLIPEQKKITNFTFHWEAPEQLNGFLQLLQRPEMKSFLQETVESQQISNPKKTVLTITPSGKIHISFEKEESEEQKWLQNLENIIQTYFDDPNFSVAELARKLTISERLLRKRIKKLTQLTPTEYLREVRLQKALRMLEDYQNYSITDICFAVGFQKPSWFTQLFKARFGKLPSACR